MKVLMLIKWLHNSGAPKMFTWLANSLVEQGIDVTVLTYLDYNGETVTLSNRVNHIHVSLNKVGLLGKIYRVRKCVKELRPDISISFLLDANVYNMFACCGLETKSVICERNDPFKPHYYKLKFWKPWFRLANGAVFQLPQVADYYSNIKNKTAIIPNPIIDRDNIMCLPIGMRKSRIVTHGRLDIEQKRHDVLIKAFALLHKEFPDYYLSIYGKDDDESGKNRKALKNLITKLELDDSVRLEGETLTPKESIKDAMLWVMTSDFEGIPNSLIEAMSMGLPCISTDCSPGGARFLIKDGINGYLVNRADVDALYVKMRYLIMNPQEANRIGNEGKNIKYTYPEKRVVSMWLKYLRSITT